MRALRTAARIVGGSIAIAGLLYYASKVQERANADRLREEQARHEVERILRENREMGASTEMYATADDWEHDHRVREANRRNTKPMDERVSRLENKNKGDE